MRSYVYIEGGGDSKDLHVRCRRGFRCLLEHCGFSGRLPRLVACGSRSAAFDDFRTAHGHAAPRDYVAMLIDSEQPVADIEATWAHLGTSEGWAKPDGADDEQVLLMVTCMETWIITDREALRRHYGSDLQESALPPPADMEGRDRTSIEDALTRATRNCTNAYSKGKRSFVVIEELDPAALRGLLPSFARFERVLGTRL